MQAICGFFNLDGKQAGAAELEHLRVAQVCNPRAHQGRFDGWSEGNVALAAAAWGGRSAGGEDSPVARHAETGCVVVADTRLDDCPALARQLALPSDRKFTQAELVLHAWLRWGEDCAEKLRGDFALALWDPRARCVFCARDIMGVRPLYVHHQPGKLFAFASRAQSLLALPGVPGDLDEGRIADLLVPKLEGIDDTCTFYCAIQRLPPAQHLTVLENHIRARRYWRLQPGRVALPQGDKAWAETVSGVLETAVARHLDGEARIGSMLSGGMDSSALAVIAADQLAAAGKGPLPTFSSLDSSAGGAETDAVLAMARLPGFRPTLIEPEAVFAAREEFAQAVWSSDEPFDATMLLLHAQYREAARLRVDALLDGIDADSLLATGSMLTRQFRRLDWLGLWRNVRGQHTMYPQLSVAAQIQHAARGALVPNWLRRLRQRHRKHEDGDATRLASTLAASVLAPDFARRVDLADRLARFDAWGHDVDRRSTASEAQHAIQNRYVGAARERYHRVAAWHGVDPRHPLDDRDVLECLVNLPDRQRMRDGFNKACLREAMRGRLPEPVRTRRNKQHLGWSLTQRLFLADQATARRALAELRPLLAPYVDAAQLELALANWGETDADPGAMDIQAALALGHWLQRATTTTARPLQGEVAPAATSSPTP